MENSISMIDSAVTRFAPLTKLVDNLADIFMPNVSGEAVCDSCLWHVPCGEPYCDANNCYMSQRHMHWIGVTTCGYLCTFACSSVLYPCPGPC